MPELPWSSAVGEGQCTREVRWSQSHALQRKTSFLGVPSKTIAALLLLPEIMERPVVSGKLSVPLSTRVSLSVLATP